MKSRIKTTRRERRLSREKKVNEYDVPRTALVIGMYVTTLTSIGLGRIKQLGPHKREGITYDYLVEFKNGDQWTQFENITDYKND